MLCFICRKAAQSNAATVTQNGVTWQNTYNADGLRTKRTGGGNTYEYVYYGGSLQYMEYNGQAVYFTHAPDGTPMGMLTDGDAYFYITDLQGDVVAILNSSGQVVVRYTYDAWGNLLSTTGSLASTIGVLNPIRYRGYVYDTETGLYYLQSRYYDPEIGRFIASDTFLSTGQGLLGNNMFAYCNNNPVNCIDYTGALPEWLEEIKKRAEHTYNFFYRMVSAPIKSLEVDIGIGVGFGITGKAAIDGLQLTVGLAKTLTDTISFVFGKVEARNTSKTTAGLNVDGFFDLMIEEGNSHSFSDPNCTCDPWNSTFGEKSTCPANQTISGSSGMIGFSAGVYLAIGAEVSVYINLEKYLNELCDIFYDSLHYD